MSQPESIEEIDMEVPASENFDDIVSSTIEQFEVLDVLDPETTMLIQTAQSMLPNVVYQIVYQEPLMLSTEAKKRGRPRNSQKKPKITPEPSTEPPQKAKVIGKTRFGREVKFPKYIEKDFESLDDVEAEMNIENEVVVAADLEKLENISEAPVHVELQQKKRKIASQYRCPKCQKAYLGKNKMLKHLQKYPSHGPVNQKQDNHFELWNYLVSITRKCPSSERGPKFCQELSNLLHNLLLLTNALFKKLGSDSSEVEVDKVLGNAIGLSPGLYYFDDNNLYKDVTVLQLMENTDFLGSLKTNLQEEEDCDYINKSHSDKLKSTLEETSFNYAKNDELLDSKPMQISEDVEIAQPMKTTKNSEEFDFSLNQYIDINPKPLPKPKNPKINILSQITLSSPYIHTKDLNHDDDELMLPLSPPRHNILDNSSSSDEVLNVDQFVNERFRKITESDLEGTLISELPPLDLFQFHTTS